MNMITTTQSGTIEKKELMDALKGMFPIEPGALEEAIEMNWHRWDADRNGTIGKRERLLHRSILRPVLQQCTMII